MFSGPTGARETRRRSIPDFDLLPLAGSLNISDKCNVLGYFESLCQDSNAANVLINSSLVALYVKMLRNAKHDRLRVQLASCLGLLLRHATYISEELSKSGILETLLEAARDKSDQVRWGRRPALALELAASGGCCCCSFVVQRRAKATCVQVRRRATATLGELLFYIATQQQDLNEDGMGGQGGAAWQVPSSVLGQFVRMLRAGEDEVQQHYAVKALENISTQPGDWGSRFASAEVLLSLVQIYHASKQDYLRSTALSTVARILKRVPALVSQVVDK